MDCSKGDEPWNWEDVDYLLDKDSALGDISECLWDNATQEADFSYMFEENTPIKACSSVPYHFGHHGDSDKASQGHRETSSQVKRRRMLHFNNEDVDLTFQSDDSSFLKSEERIDAVDDASTEPPEWDITRLQEDISSSGLKCLDHSEGWFVDCLNDSEMQVSADDIYSSGSSGVHIDIIGGASHEFTAAQPNVGFTLAQQHTVRTFQNVIFKGRKSYMRTPTKLASSVAYPFTFIKPSGVNGDVTLKDLNQRIQTPPPLKAKDDLNFGTSAFSGKPVVNKTRIRTDGGKGCITIMRTKG